ncbi:MAG: hypothetical protein HKN67_11150 [Saprospiraceae bacterium]|nr:hypothetical protein [Saprospiraceae bacterium]
MKISREQILILVNLSANDKKAESKWLHIRDEVFSVLGGKVRVVEYRPPFDLELCLEEIMADLDIKFIISAGGDGSLNYLVNHLMTLPVSQRMKFTVGAIGLGSSNDALKPFHKFIQGVPVNIDYNSSALVDIGKVVMDSNTQEQFYFLNNISFGVTANANALFNKSDFILKMIKRRFTNLAIIYSALKTIVHHQNIQSVLKFNNKIIESNLSTLSILKTPFLAGILRYDQDIQRNDGFLGVNLCDGMTRMQLIKTVYALSKTRFSARKKCLSFLAKDIEVHFNDKVNIEIDGEIQRGQAFKISLAPKCLNYISSPQKTQL